MTARLARGTGLATVTDEGTVLDVWYPDPVLVGDDAPEAPARTALPVAERRDEARGVHTRVITAEIDLDAPPTSVVDAYLRLHLLSHQPGGLNT